MSLRNGPLRASDESDACILFGLAPDGVYQAAEVTPSAGALLPHRFTLTFFTKGGLFSVALAIGLLRLVVNQHPAP